VVPYAITQAEAKQLFVVSKMLAVEDEILPSRLSSPPVSRLLTFVDFLEALARIAAQVNYANEIGLIYVNLFAFFCGSRLCCQK
jgi:hypothetical protein